jgi:hypothetical protein
MRVAAPDNGETLLLKKEELTMTQLEKVLYTAKKQEVPHEY